MSDDASGDGTMTRLLASVRAGDEGALDRLVPLIYDDLRAMARRQLGREHEARTLQATALVHEAYAKLAASHSLRPRDRTHFVAIAARAMRQVLVEDARRRKSAKRGGGWNRTTLTPRVGESYELDPEELLALDQALGELGDRQRQVVELRFFGGLTEREVAELLDVTPRTVRRDWVKARAHLYRRLYVGGAGPVEDSDPVQGSPAKGRSDSIHPVSSGGEPGGEPGEGGEP